METNYKKLHGIYRNIKEFKIRYQPGINLQINEYAELHITVTRFKNANKFI